MPPAALWTMWTSWTLWTAIFGFRVHVVHAVHIVHSSAPSGLGKGERPPVPAAYAAGYVLSPLRGSPPSRQPALPSRLAHSRRPHHGRAKLLLSRHAISPRPSPASRPSGPSSPPASPSSSPRSRTGSSGTSDPRHATLRFSGGPRSGLSAATGCSAALPFDHFCSLYITRHTSCSERS